MVRSPWQLHEIEIATSCAGIFMVVKSLVVTVYSLLVPFSVLRTDFSLIIMVLAWMYDNNDADQREPHRMEPNQSVSLDELKNIGVEYFHFTVDGHEDSQDYKNLRSSRGYTYEDVIAVNPSTLPNYEQKIAMFFQEHLHTDEEIRYCMEGSGYFDVRDANDRWIRIELHEGDLIILPAGIYHRFTVDLKNYIKAKRLFIGEPVWTPHNRPSDDMPARKQYVNNFLACPS